MRVLRGFNEFGPFGPIRDLPRKRQREIGHRGASGGVDLVPRVARTVIVGVKSREEIDGRDLSQKKRRVVARAGSRTSMKGVQADAAALLRDLQVIFDGWSARKPVNEDFAARAANHVEVDHRDRVLERYRWMLHVIRRTQQSE